MKTALSHTSQGSAKPLRPLTRQLALMGLTMALAACSVGPNFVRPDAPADTGYTSGPTSTGTVDAGGQAQTWAAGSAPARWWTAFGSERLNALVDEGLVHNPDLRSTEASLSTARTVLQAQTNQSTLPQVGLQAGASRQRALGSPGSVPPTSTYEVYSGVINAQYDLDLFGAVRRSNEAAGAHVDVSFYQYQAQQQVLVANIVATAIRAAALKAQLQELQAWEDTARQQLAWTRRREALGAVSHTDVWDAERASLEVSRQRPALESAWHTARHGLAILLGRSPQNAPDDLTLDELQLPAQVAMEVPSQLVRHRPDILAAEASLHEATARLGQATANLYPQIRLSASYGSQSYTTGLFGQEASTVWSIAGGLVQPLFQGGALQDLKAAAETYLRASSEQYQATVLRAFQNVADALRTLEGDAQLLATQDRTRQDATEALATARQRAAVGALSAPELAQREGIWHQERLRWIAAHSARLVDTVALYQATAAPVSESALAAK